jgi:hypothetical protein
MQFELVKQFFEAWGLTPGAEHLLSDTQLDFMMRSAIQKSNEFEIFCTLMIDCKSDGHSLGVDSWDKLKTYWETFVETGKLK